jgi:hypothetical protein
MSSQIEINAQTVIDSLLDQNKQLTLQVAILQSVIKDLEDRVGMGQEIEPTEGQ